MSADLSFALLGPLEVRRDDGSEVELGGPQARLLLARLLVAEGRAVSTDSLVDTVWESDPPSSAVGMIQTYVSRLRRAFGADGTELIRFRPGGYALDVPADRVDAQRFEQLVTEGGSRLADADPGAGAVLRAALGLWRGPVLDGMDADFARSTAARLDERRLTAVEDLLEAELRAGRHSAVVADLTEAVAEAPLRERRRGLLAVALYRSGRQADALAVLDDGRRVMRDGWGWTWVGSWPSCRPGSSARTRGWTPSGSPSPRYPPTPPGSSRTPALHRARTPG